MRDAKTIKMPLCHLAILTASFFWGGIFHSPDTKVTVVHHPRGQDSSKAFRVIIFDSCNGLRVCCVTGEVQCTQNEEGARARARTHTHTNTRARAPYVVHGVAIVQHDIAWPL